MLSVARLRVIDAVARHGSVTAAARELHYSQPSVSHHLAGLVRLAGFASALGSLVPRAVAALAGRHPGLQISLIDTHPPEALDLLRAGRIEVAVIFRYDETEPEPDGVRLHHLLDDPVYLLSRRRERKLAALRDATWIAGCERCRSHLLSLCADAGYEPRIGYTSDDMVVMQALVAAGLGVTTLPGLALRAHRAEGIVARGCHAQVGRHLEPALARRAQDAGGVALRLGDDRVGRVAIEQSPRGLVRAALLRPHAGLLDHRLAVVVLAPRDEGARG